MRPKSMVLILFALGCGLVASIGISQVMESRARSGGTVEMQQIYVAQVDIPQRSALTPEMVKLEEWPKDRVPIGAITKLEALEGRKPRHPLYAGEPILETKLIDPQKDLGLVSNKIREGYRAIAVKVDGEVSTANLILPGDRVDVLVFLQKRPPEVLQTTTTTILRNVTVFAVNDQTSLQTDRGETSVAAKTVTLEVKPQDAERLMLAQSLGKLRLVLRRGDDETEDSESDGVGVQSLFAGQSSEPMKASTGPDNGAAVAAAGKGLLQMLNDFSKPQPVSTDSNNTASSDELPTMTIMTPSGIEEFTWDKEGELPRELRGEIASTLPPPPTTPAPVTPAALPTIPGMPPIPGLTPPAGIPGLTAPPTEGQTPAEAQDVPTAGS